MRRDFTAILAAMAFALPGVAAAQSRIEVGATVSGSLDARDARLSDDSYYDCYLLRIDQAQSVSIALRSGAFDAYLAVGYGVNCGGEAAETNDDGPSMGTDSLLELDFQPGEYFIRANSLSAARTGAYTLSIQPTGGRSADASIITVEGALTSDDRKLDDDSYYDCVDVRGRAGQTLTAGMESEEVDAYLVILDGAGCRGEILGANDDAEGLGTDALVEVTLPRDGVYSIRANSLAPGETGAYLLHYLVN